MFPSSGLTLQVKYPEEKRDGRPDPQKERDKNICFLWRCYLRFISVGSLPLSLFHFFPLVRALTFDTLGLIKVLESREKQGGLKVVERWVNLMLPFISCSKEEWPRTLLLGFMVGLKTGFVFYMCY
ncbi:unnamed protein product [Vicia faba]|uniref:Uncharacterized protein n=1 Tax=Vicia faba TaxID=3906 RepID=A0AAV0YPJ0_VICFA|nr:unnamed protein product [Vicia faba]